MPKAFLDCAKAKGSRVRTKRLSGGRYRKFCWRPGSKKATAGHVEKKKAAS